MQEQRILAHLKRLANAANGSRNLSKEEVAALRELVAVNKPKRDDDLPPWERHSSVASKRRFDPISSGIGMPPLESRTCYFEGAISV